MAESVQKKLGGAGLGVGRRKLVELPQDTLVTESFLPDTTLPLVLQPSVEGIDWRAWASSPENRALVQARIVTYGGVLFRNFPITSVTDFEQLVEACSGSLLEYQERSSPRSQVNGNVYTSTDHPATQRIFLHNEQSYNITWPQKISFCCLIAAQQGGETPIADCRKIFQRIDPTIRERFIAKRYMYVRNFGAGLGLSWQTAFQTSDKAAVEAYCRENQIEFEWRGGDRLRTRQIRPAAAQHPQTGEWTWFNHATFFHVSTLEPAIRDALLAEFAEDELPNNTFYGDGTAIEPDVLDHLRNAYQQETVMFSWQQGDVLMLDNMLTAHARMPFVGPRKVVVAMTEPMSHEQR